MTDSHQNYEIVKFIIFYILPVLLLSISIFFLASINYFDKKRVQLQRKSLENLRQLVENVTASALAQHRTALMLAGLIQKSAGKKGVVWDAEERRNSYGNQPDK